MIRKIRMQNEEGFTLIELMIVIAIIGILAAIAIPNFIAYRNKGFCSGAESDAHNIAASISDYFAIPANTTIADKNGETVKFGNGAVYDLSGANTCDVKVTAATSTAPIQIKIVVKDVSTRCPKDYMTSQSNAGWDSATNTFTKNM